MSLSNKWEPETRQFLSDTACSMHRVKENIKIYVMFMLSSYLVDKVFDTESHVTHNHSYPIVVKEVGFNV